MKDETEETNVNTAQEINNVYVSIKDENAAIIGFPYEFRIPTLKDGCDSRRIDVFKIINPYR